MHVLFKLADAPCAEGVRDDLALTSVGGTIAHVEQAAVDRDEGVVEGAESGSTLTITQWKTWNQPLQEAITVAVYKRNSGVIQNADMVRLYADKFAILLVCCVDSNGSPGES